MLKLNSLNNSLRKGMLKKKTTKKTGRVQGNLKGYLTISRLIIKLRPERSREGSSNKNQIERSHGKGCLKYNPACVHACSVTSVCPTLCNPMDCSPPGSSVHGILQARISRIGLPCPPLGNLPNPGIEPISPALQADSLPLSHQEAQAIILTRDNLTGGRQVCEVETLGTPSLVFLRSLASCPLQMSTTRSQGPRSPLILVHRVQPPRHMAGQSVMKGTNRSSLTLSQCFWELSYTFPYAYYLELLQDEYQEVNLVDLSYYTK